jgi:putative sigma-54 modulation protein
MTFTITGRNVNVSDRLHEYVEKKLPRIEKFFHQLMEVRVILVTEKQDHIAEMVVVGDGAHLYGQETGGDFYSALDLLIDKIEKQVSRYKEKQQLHKGTSLGELTLVDVNSDEFTEITIENASAKPVDETEAFLQMRLDGREFILFKKGEKTIAGGGFESNSLALLYKNGEALRLAEVDCAARSGECDPEVKEFDVKVVEESPTKPKIKCSKSGEITIDSILLIDATRELAATGKKFIPFVNRETGFLNVVFKDGGKKVGVLIPAAE